ncbi:MAG TPA: carboxymuconolactone decarboxylase family protein [Candidatus Dormibacteraeota bacterium]|jgi:alkylhydroperoxidase/carboxymuconolactone decarboxylase family protein YurZ|nr:carboxymuconolactone decarboxylase family protein [Candidatus Dormibacteraeota bacterium]
MTNGRYEHGLDVYASQFRIPRDEVASWFAERVGERFGEEAILSAAGAWVGDELSLRDRSLIVVAALIAQGGAEQQLRVHARWAIEHGCTPQQLEALATLLGVYAGYPRASNGMMIVREELTKIGYARSGPP